MTETASRRDVHRTRSAPRAAPADADLHAPAPDAPTTPAAAATATRLRDSQRARVYRAEDAWGQRLDAARRGAPLALVGGSRVVLPAEKRFGTLEAAAEYAGRVLRLPPVVADFGAVPPPLLRRRKGQRSAHWEPPGVVAVPLPEHGEPWAMRECVLLHELAHHVGHVTGSAQLHLAPFPAVLLRLVDAALGPEAALALRVDYGRERVQVGVL